MAAATDILKPMTSRMRMFLESAASVAPKKGILLHHTIHRIASRAVSDGHGMIIDGGFGPIFIIDDKARDAIAQSEAAP